MAVAVVRCAFAVVLEDLVGLGRFLETLLGAFVARIAVRVMLHRQLAIRFLDRVDAGVVADPQNLVIVALRHEVPP